MVFPALCLYFPKSLVSDTGVVSPQPAELLEALRTLLRTHAGGAQLSLSEQVPGASGYAWAFNALPRSIPGRAPAQDDNQVNEGSLRARNGSDYLT